MPASVEIFDGVATMARGDTLLVVYSVAARLHRSSWIFDCAEKLIEDNPEGILCLLLVTSSADPPDAATRAENARRYGRLGSSLRMMVTVPVGNALWVSVVSAVMRGISMFHGHPESHAVSRTFADGMARLFEAAGPKTPSYAQIEEDLREMFRALKLAPPSALTSSDVRRPARRV